LQAANSLDEEFIYCKHDGSLRRGFEIVTHPATIQHHMQTFPWSAITKKALELGYSSHKAVTCGLHVHISKVAFGDDWQTQDASLAKFLWLFERFWGQIFLFSRRDMEQLNHYAAKYHKRDYEKADDLLYKAKRAGRFYAVNLQNSNTVEVRVFRGTLKVDTIKASIQFCELFRHIAADYSLHYVQRITWNKIISLAQKLGYSEFVTYCAERGIVEN
jgi:hypothetical protein